MGTPNTGAKAKVAFDVALPFDGSSIPIEIISNTLGKQGSILSTDGLRGTRQYPRSRTRTGTYVVSGQLAMACSPLMMDYFLPMILGGNEATDVFDISETLQQFYLMEDTGAKVATWSGVIVSKATFRAQAGQMLMVVLDVEAETESIGNAGTFPSLTMPTDSPWVMSDSVLTLQAAAREYSQGEMVVDNQIAVDRFMNTLTRTDFPSSGVLVTFATDHPWTSSETDLYNQTLNGAVGSWVFTNADDTNNVLTIALGYLQVPAKHPELAGRGEITLPLQMTARQHSTTPSVRITNVHA